MTGRAAPCPRFREWSWVEGVGEEPLLQGLGNRVVGVSSPGAGAMSQTACYSTRGVTTSVGRSPIFLPGTNDSLVLHYFCCVPRAHVSGNGHCLAAGQTSKRREEGVVVPRGSLLLWSGWIQDHTSSRPTTDLPRLHPDVYEVHVLSLPSLSNQRTLPESPSVPVTGPEDLKGPLQVPNPPVSGSIPPFCIVTFRGTKGGGVGRGRRQRGPPRR